MPVLKTLCLFFALFIGSSSVLAQQWRVEQPTTIDKAYMQDQRDRVDTLTRRHFGRQLTGQRSNDFPLMQRLLDEGIVSGDDTLTLQAMGVILGDTLKSEQSLNWTIYIDRYGRSRALAIPGQRDVLFPITMVSRRAEVGIRVDINEVYQKALKELEAVRKQIIVY